MQQPALHETPARHLRAARPARPVLYFAPKALAERAAAFRAGFPGEVTFAVKANPDPAVIENLARAGIAGFDVASPAEMALVRGIAPAARLHYHNPIRSDAEIAEGVRRGCASWSVDDPLQLEKLLAARVPGLILVRLKLPVKGARYDFGSKFGADPAAAAALLRRVARAGRKAGVTFHPGTQCPDPAAWTAYIRAAADAARAAGVPLAHLNVGGGFPSASAGPLAPIFDAIRDAVAAAFDAPPPPLSCEPGRAMVADCFALAARVKAVRADGAAFLDDGIYGHLSEAPLIGTPRFAVLSPEGEERSAPAIPRTVFGPTCDSLDRLPEPAALPADTREGDWMLFHGVGAYGQSNMTRFNGYGLADTVNVARLL
ncbi:ornithine decarboxylase [Hasllibacter halocynthiae]|uniref:ornithine decarboxylase n=1 Tax=Hasllibacter halocynthiae TaxID=595589 RepID=A0A2T0X6A6_9RHOB|nr:alanine racemase [Hasllibacter halocynthiae]PRY94457.1 ornithine decarboxylase [Hasllibacter halocynthiae]